MPHEEEEADAIIPVTNKEVVEESSGLNIEIDEPLKNVTVLEPVDIEPKNEEGILLRLIPQGAGSKLDSDTVRGEIPLTNIQITNITNLNNLLALLF